MLAFGLGRKALSGPSQQIPDAAVGLSEETVALDQPAAAAEKMPVCNVQCLRASLVQLLKLAVKQDLRLHEKKQMQEGPF